MATYKTTTIPISSAFEQQQDRKSLCCIRWRQRQLLVSLEKPNIQPCLPALESEQWLVECLKCSSVKLVRIDAALGEVNLKLWADACEKADKSVFLSLPFTIKLPKQRRSRGWWLGQLIDRSIAALLLLVLSPVIVGLFCLLRWRSPTQIFLRQWHVGDRGRLFRIWKFRTTTPDDQTLENDLTAAKNILKPQNNFPNKTLGHWMSKYKLDELPKLFNVLRGEMGLTQLYPLSLEQAARLSLEAHKSIEVRQSKEFVNKADRLQPAGTECTT